MPNTNNESNERGVRRGNTQNRRVVNQQPAGAQNQQEQSGATNPSAPGPSLSARQARNRRRRANQRNRRRAANEARRQNAPAPGDTTNPTETPTVVLEQSVNVPEEVSRGPGSDLAPTLFQHPTPVEYNEQTYQPIGLFGRCSRRVKRRWHRLRYWVSRNSCYSTPEPNEEQLQMLERIHNLTLEIHPDRRTTERLVGIISTPLDEGPAPSNPDRLHGPWLFPDNPGFEVREVIHTVTSTEIANSLLRGVDIDVYRPSGGAYRIPFASVWLQDRMRYHHPGLPTTGNTLHVKMRNYLESLRKRVITVQSMKEPKPLTPDEEFVRDHIPESASTHVVGVAALLYSLPTYQQCLERDILNMPAVRELRARGAGLPSP